MGQTTLVCTSSWLLSIFRQSLGATCLHWKHTVLPSCLRQNWQHHSLHSVTLRIQSYIHIYFFRLMQIIQHFGSQWWQSAFNVALLSILKVNSSRFYFWQQYGAILATYNYVMHQIVVSLTTVKQRMAKESQAFSRLANHFIVVLATTWNHLLPCKASVISYLYYWPMSWKVPSGLNYIWFCYIKIALRLRSTAPKAQRVLA